MKKIKKLIYPTALALSLTLGAVLGFMPTQVMASNPIGDIQCSSFADVNPEKTYVDCSTCLRVSGKERLPLGTCTTSPPVE